MAKKRSYSAALGHLRRAIDRATTPEDKFRAIDTYLGALSSERVALNMLTLATNDGPFVFWRVFALNWPRCDASYQWNGHFRDVFKRMGPLPVHLRDDFWRALPKTVKVYRGTDASRVDGFCWTTRRKTAAGFATGMRGGPFPDPVIATGFVKKADVYYAAEGRSEFEVLCDPVRVTIEASR